MWRLLAVALACLWASTSWAQRGNNPYIQNLQLQGLVGGVASGASGTAVVGPAQFLLLVAGPGNNILQANGVDKICLAGTC